MKTFSETLKNKSQNLAQGPKEKRSIFARPNSLRPKRSLVKIASVRPVKVALAPQGK